MAGDRDYLYGVRIRLDLFDAFERPLFRQTTEKPAERQRYNYPGSRSRLSTRYVEFKTSTNLAYPVRPTEFDPTSKLANG